MAGLAAGRGLPARRVLGPLQPAVLDVREPQLLRELAGRVPRLESLGVREPEPGTEEPPLEVPVPAAPAKEVPALLPLLLAQPVSVPPPPPGSRAGPGPQWVSPACLVALRLRARGVPGAAPSAAGPVPDAVAEPDALPSERARSNGALRNSKSQCSKSFRNSQA